MTLIGAALLATIVTIFVSEALARKYAWQIAKPISILAALVLPLSVFFVLFFGEDADFSRAMIQALFD
jgi:hypothetical protein